MTPEQREQARACLGCGHGPRTLWNYRSLRPSNPVWTIWNQMVEAGLATVERVGSAWCPDLHCFKLTPAAAKMALAPDEVLCNIDFPEGGDIAHT